MKYWQSGAEHASGEHDASLPSRFLLPPRQPVADLSLRSWLLAALFFAAGVWLYNRHNGFPCYYHPEEPGKARQLLLERFNFHHPLLLLQATWLTSWITRPPQMPQPVVETGRTVSAIFACGAVACFSLLAAHLYGSAAAACVGALLLANSQLYELAHYMKEDAAFAFGIAAFFLALTRCWLRPSMIRFAVLGAAAALAVSAKYIGALAVPLAFMPAFQLREKGRHRVLILSAAFFAVLLVISFPIFASLDSFLRGLGREVDFVLHGHKGLTRSVPHDFYVAVFLGATNPVIWTLLGVYYVRLFTFRRRIHPAEWMLTLFSILYVLILSFSPKAANHYFLPDTLIFCTLAAFGLFCFTLGGSARITFGIQAAGLLAAFGISVAHLIPYDFAFKVDSRQQFLAFVRQNVPPTATLAQDRSVNLPNRNDPRHAAPYFLEQTIVGRFFAADVGSIDELRARGIRYIAVAEREYGRFFRRTHRPTKSILADYNRRRNFYERLFREGELLWECKAGLLPILQPHIRLYYLPSEPRSGRRKVDDLKSRMCKEAHMRAVDWPRSDPLVKIVGIRCSKDVVGHALVARARTPIQSGENWSGTLDMEHAIEAHASDFVMPDVMKIGGVTGWLRAAALAHARGIQVSNHLWPKISARLLCCTPTAHLLEYADWWNPILAEPLCVGKGMAIVSDAAGTGVTGTKTRCTVYVLKRYASLFAGCQRK